MLVTNRLYPALNLAVWCGHAPIAQLLLARPLVDVDHTGASGGDAPLTCACTKGWVAIAAALLAEGADPAAGTRHGLHAAAENGHDALVAMLVRARGARVDARGRERGREQSVPCGRERGRGLSFVRDARARARARRASAGRERARARARACLLYTSPSPRDRG